MVNVDIDAVVRADLPTFKRLLGILEEHYRPPIVTPSTDMNTIMYNAGQYSVLQNLKIIVERVESENRTIKEV